MVSVVISVQHFYGTCIQVEVFVLATVIKLWVLEWTIGKYLELSLDPMS